MAIHEYGCRSCEKQFEILVRNNNEIICPSCGGKDLRRKLSVYGFVSSSKFVGSRGNSCAGCFKNNCSSCNS